MASNIKEQIAILEEMARPTNYEGRHGQVVEIELVGIVKEEVAKRALLIINQLTKEK